MAFNIIIIMVTRSADLENQNFISFVEFKKLVKEKSCYEDIADDSRNLTANEEANKSVLSSFKLEFIETGKMEFLRNSFNHRLNNFDWKSTTSLATTFY